MRRLAVLALLGALLAIAPAEPASAAPPVFEDDFETGDLSKWDNVHTGRYAITSDPANVKDGANAL